MAIMRRLLIALILPVVIVSCNGISPRETAYSGSTPLELVSEGSLTAERARNVDFTGVLTGQVPLVTFVFDDGNDTDYLVARDVFREQGAVACSAITTGWIDTPGFLSKGQILGLRDAGWEIMAHTETHPNLSSVSPARIEEELSRSKATLESMGIAVKNLVYPYNKSNEMVRTIARKYYRSGRGGTNEVNTKSTDSYYLKSYSNKHDLAGMKDYIDRAYVNRSWIIIYHHQVDIKVDIDERHGRFIPGEKLFFSPSGATGRYEPPTWYLFFGSLYFVPLSGTPKAGDTITGAASGAAARLDHVLYDERAQIGEMIRYVRTRYPDMRIVTIEQGLDLLGISQRATGESKPEETANKAR